MTIKIYIHSNDALKVIKPTNPKRLVCISIYLFNRFKRVEKTKLISDLKTVEELLKKSNIGYYTLGIYSMNIRDIRMYLRKNYSMTTSHIQNLRYGI